ncbi:MAG: ParB/RepB/Spo0J family partition protein [Thermoanaerobaculales bacterium]|nr:ParB/RepB/Spo0J family partition protein [Thermoanaerobaculales bacterium]
MAKRALGRGLKALMPDVPTARAGFAEIDVERLYANPKQPRNRFENEALESLAASIRKHGILQPLLVSELGSGKFKILAGERRWRAAKKAGLKQIPVVIREQVDEERALEIALVENLQRRDLTPLEEARAYHVLRAEGGLTQAQIAEKVGFDRSTVANALRLLKLPEPVQEMVEAGRLTAGHGRALLSFSDAEAQILWAEAAIRDDLSVREIERTASQANRAAGEKGAPKKAAPARDPNIIIAENKLSLKLGAKIEIKVSNRGGRIVVKCDSQDEFLRVYDLLVGEE